MVQCCCFCCCCCHRIMYIYQHTTISCWCTLYQHIDQQSPTSPERQGPLAHPVVMFVLWIIDLQCDQHSWCQLSWLLFHIMKWWRLGWYFSVSSDNLHWTNHLQYRRATNSTLSMLFYLCHVTYMYMLFYPMVVVVSPISSTKHEPICVNPPNTNVPPPLSIASNSSHPHLIVVWSLYSIEILTITTIASSSTLHLSSPEC